MRYRLDAVNFFLADVRGGLGAFVSVFLLTEAQWTAAQIGAVLTVSGLIGITLHTPIGALIDATRAKRGLLVVAVALLALCAIAIERAPTGPVVFLADIIMAVLGGVFAPTVAALTLGLVAERDLAARLARNAVFDRIGNMFIAALVGVVGWWLSQRVTFYLVPLFALLSAWAVLSIPASAIEHERARGFAPNQPVVRAESWGRLLFHHKPLLALAATVAMFHFANASMLPLVGQKLALAHPGFETALVSVCILVAQLVTIPVAIVVGIKADVWSHKVLLIAACLALALRGLVFCILRQCATPHRSPDPRRHQRRHPGCPYPAHAGGDRRRHRALQHEPWSGRHRSRRGRFPEQCGCGRNGCMGGIRCSLCRPRIGGSHCCPPRRCYPKQPEPYRGRRYRIQLSSGRKRSTAV